MTVHVVIDDIRLLMPGIGEEEYQARKRLRTARTIATAAQIDAPGEGSRALFHLINEACTVWLYRPASIEQLNEAVELAQHLYRAAQVAERLEGLNG